MRVAIHHRKGSFSDQWIKYCKLNSIDYKIVDAYDTNIIEQVKDCDVFMWHHHHGDFKDVLVAKTILFTLEQSGMKVFPNFKTGWHFDDKVSQKYVLEANDAPLVPSFVFYDRDKALLWAKNTSYPKVFKLKGGAGASNVLLIKDFNQCKKIIYKAFSSGFSQYNISNAFKEKIRLFSDTYNPIHLIKGILRFFVKPTFAKQAPKEKGYVYFQDFMPKNDFDIRLIVIKDRAYGMKRMNRKGDFRASGSSDFVYDEINDKVLKIAFDVSKKLSSQSVAFDFIFDQNNNPVIIEMSYGFGTKGSSQCTGYWTNDLKWHTSDFNPEYWMIENLLKDARNER